MSDYSGAYERALLILSHRDHFEGQLHKKLTDKGFPEEDILDALNELKKLKYLDDYRVAISYVNSLKSKSSVYDIRYKMKSKGVDDSVINSAIRDSNIDEKQVAFDLLCKKLGINPEYAKEENIDFEHMKKACSYLQRKGFKFESINYARKQIGQN